MICDVRRKFRESVGALLPGDRGGWREVCPGKSLLRKRSSCKTLNVTAEYLEDVDEVDEVFELDGIYLSQSAQTVLRPVQT